MALNAVVRELPYHYTQREHLREGQMLSEKLREKEQLEQQLATIKTDFKGRIDAIAAAAHVHAENVRRGYEFRSTECTAYFDTPRKGLKTIFRNDTGEIAAEEHMTPADRQMVMQWEEEQSCKAEESHVTQEAADVVEFPGEHPDPTDQEEKEAPGEEAGEGGAEPDAETNTENEPKEDRTEVQE